MFRSLPQDTRGRGNMRGLKTPKELISSVGNVRYNDIIGHRETDGDDLGSLD